MRVGRIQIQRAVAIASACAACASLAACGSSATPAGTAVGTAPVVPAPQTPPGTPASRIVRMHNLAFSATTVHVRVGQTIKWVNDDNVVHNVTSSDGLTIQSGNFGPRHSYEYTPKLAGTITYYCTIHPTTMQATIVVVR
jgi:plastocyanin